MNAEVNGSQAGAGAQGETLWSTLPALEQVEAKVWQTTGHMWSEGLLIREGTFRIDGGELMAHAIQLVEDQYPGRRCVGLNTLFAREGRHEHATVYELGEVHRGRNFAFATLLARQPERGPIAHFQAIVAGPLVGPSHQGARAPEVDWSDAAQDLGELFISPVEVAGGRKLGDPEPGEPEARARVTVPDSLADPTEVRMYLSFVLDHTVIAPALRPHAGIGYRTKKQFYTAPMALSLRFWRDIEPGETIVFDMTGPVMAGGLGITHSHGFDATGAVVLSCTMDVVAREAD